MQRVCGAHFHVIAPGQHSFFGKNVAAVANRWQHCAQFDRPEICTSDLPLQRRTRYRSTNWPVLLLMLDLKFPSFKLPTDKLTLLSPLIVAYQQFHLHLLLVCFIVRYHCCFYFAFVLFCVFAFSLLLQRRCKLGDRAAQIVATLVFRISSSLCALSFFTFLYTTQTMWQ